MKEAIDWRAIREGDLIRWEKVGEHPPGRVLSIEYRASRDEHRRFSDGQYYLLDRPKPAVVLPEVPTLGWATFSLFPETELGVWERITYSSGNDVLRARMQHQVTQASDVTAFTEAVAVPKSALDEFRAAATAVDGDGDESLSDWEYRLLFEKAIRTFLAAIDEANS